MSKEKLPNLFVQNPCNLGNGYAVPVHSFERAKAPTAEMYVPARSIRELVEKLEQRVAGMQGGVFNAARVPYEMCIEQLNKLCEREAMSDKPDTVSVYRCSLGWVWHRYVHRLERIVSECHGGYHLRATCIRWAKKLNPGCEFDIEEERP